MAVAQRDVIGVGHLGKVEDELVHWWREAWTPIRSYLGSQIFLDHLGPNPSADTMITLVNIVIDRGAAIFVQHILPAINVIVHYAGDQELTRAGMMLNTLVIKFEEPVNPFRRNTAAWWRWLERHGEAPPTVDAYTRFRETAKAITASWVGDITASQKRQVEKVIRDGLAKNVPVEQLAKRIANLIGLNERWIKAVENLRAQMVEDEYPASIVAKRMKRYADKLLIKRGVMVARTEIMTALNAGEWAAWKLKEQAGELDGWTVEKWLQPMEDACAECWAAADPNASGQPEVVTGLDAGFSGGDLVYPPIHPHCRCRVAYRVVRSQA